MIEVTSWTMNFYIKNIIETKVFVVYQGVLIDCRRSNEHGCNLLNNSILRKKLLTFIRSIKEPVKYITQEDRNYRMVRRDFLFFGQTSKVRVSMIFIKGSFVYSNLNKTSSGVQEDSFKLRHFNNIIYCYLIFKILIMPTNLKWTKQNSKA
jgi:hypothetical protein